MREHRVKPEIGFSMPVYRQARYDWRGYFEDPRCPVVYGSRRGIEAHTENLNFYEGLCRPMCPGLLWCGKGTLPMLPWLSPGGAYTVGFEDIFTAKGVFCSRAMHRWSITREHCGKTSGRMPRQMCRGCWGLRIRSMNADGTDKRLLKGQPSHIPC